MGILADFIAGEAAKKSKSTADWLKDVAKNAKKCRLATHVSKFVHPDTNVNVNVPRYVKPNGNYVATESVNCPPDIATSANYLATAKMLLLKTEDGRTVYEHVVEEPEFLQKELSALLLGHDGTQNQAGTVAGQVEQSSVELESSLFDDASVSDSLDFDFAALRKDLLSVETVYTPASTDGRLRQVYFPVDNGDDYHLLTVLSPSSVIVELRNRIRAMEENMWAVRKKDVAGDVYEQIPELTEIGIGGTKPQNISTLNNNAGGRMYMLASMPPVLQKHKIAFPRYSFFENTLYYKDFIDLFQALHKIYKKGNDEQNNKNHNNKKMRDQARKLEKMVVKRAMKEAYILRYEAPGWSNQENSHLPEDEKIFLDRQYEEIRNNETEWAEEVADKFARWFYNAYKSVVGKGAFELGDGEFKDLKYRIVDILKDTV